MITKSFQRAFTLAELLVVLAIISILAFAAVPSFSGLLSKLKTRDDVSTLTANLTFARTTAISSGGFTVVCPWTPSDGCHSNWNAEISVFKDRNNDKEPDGSNRMRVFTLTNGDLKITPRPAGKRYFSFSPSGSINGQAGSFVICSEPENTASGMAYLAVNFGGRPRVQWDEDGDRKLSIASGSTLTCP